MKTQVDGITKIDTLVAVVEAANRVATPGQLMHYSVRLDIRLAGTDTADLVEKLMQLSPAFGALQHEFSADLVITGVAPEEGGSASEESSDAVTTHPANTGKVRFKAFKGKRSRSAQLFEMILEQTHSTQLELADRLGVSQTQMSGLLYGSRRLSDKVFKKVCEAIPMTSQFRNHLSQSRLPELLD